VTDESELSRVEQMLRSTPPPLEVPEHLERAARGAALDPDVTRSRERRLARRRTLRGRLLPAAAVLTAAVAASLVIGVGGRSPSITVVQTVPLAARAGAASGTLQLGTIRGRMRPIVLRVQNLPAAPKGHYYEMWFGDGRKRIGLLPFDTTGGRATVVSAIPAGITWTACWVTLEDYHEGGTAPPVLSSVGAT
jgi:hypothetical protein